MKQLWENKQVYTLLVALQSGSTSSTLATAIKMEDSIGPRNVGHLSYKDTQTCTKTNGRCNRKSCALVSVFPGKTLQLLKITGQCYGANPDQHCPTGLPGLGEQPTSLLCHLGASCRLQEAAEPREVAGVTGNSVFLFHPISLPWLVTTV